MAVDVQDGNDNKVLERLLQNTDLFATGNDSSDSESDDEQQQPDREHLNHHHHPTPSPEATPPPSPGAKKKKKRGSKSTESSKKRQRSKKSDVRQILSESQRIVRESGVSLPKYQPKMKTLDGFLSRLKTRKPGAGGGGRGGRGSSSLAVVSLKTAAAAPLPLMEETLTARDKENEPCAAGVSPDTHTPNDDDTPPTQNNNPTTASMSEQTPGVGENDIHLAPSISTAHDINIPETTTTTDHVHVNGVHVQQPVVGSDPTLSTESDVAGDCCVTGRDNEGGRYHDSMSGEQSKTAPLHSSGGGECIEEEGVVGDKDATSEMGTDKPLKSTTTKQPQQHSHQQRTITSLFTALNTRRQTDNTKEQGKEEGGEPFSNQTSSQPPSFKASLPAVAATPQLSSLGEFRLEQNESGQEERELSDVERFQQRLSKHLVVPHLPKRGPAGVGASQSQPGSMGGEGGGAKVTPLVSEEVITKLQGKPGAIRQHWRESIRRKLSQRKAEERRVVQEKRRLYSEEEEAMEEEEEGEMTDGDTTDAETSDEEYIQKEEAVNEESDVCSDFSDQDNDQFEADDGDVNQNQDNEGAVLFRSQLTKRKPNALKVLDSDDDDSDNENDGTTVAGDHMTVTGDHMMPPPNESTVDSASLFGGAPSLVGETKKDFSNEMKKEFFSAGTKKSEAAMRRPSFLVDPEEASMPPLVLNESFESSSSEDSYTHSPPKAGSEVKAPPTNGGGGVRFTESESEPCKDDASMMAVAATGDEGSLDTTATGQTDEVGDQDNSLEMSFQWGGQSLPPAQLRQEGSGRELHDKKKPRLRAQLSFHPDSQWKPTTQATPLTTQGEELCTQFNDEESQFLDEDGFLCLRKEKKYNSPVSAIKSIVDPTQEGCSSSELLDLCSGQFNQSQHQDHVTERRRHPSDDGSTQGVRELLGLPLQSKPPSILKLLDRERGSGNSLLKESSQTSSEMSEVIGLCSGVFPTTQAASSEVIGLCSGVFPTTQAPTQRTLKRGSLNTASVSSRAGAAGETSDGESESEGEKMAFDLTTGDEAVLRWAERQRSKVNRRVPARDVNDSEDDEDMPVIKRRRVRLKHKPTKGDRLAEFVESEAELSGSDVGSERDEEDDLYAGGEYEDEEGAGSDVPLSDSELWDQVNKAHMKETLAEDKADLREFKERFLKEGDLYEDGLTMKNGFFRTRHFNPRGSEAGSLDLFSEGAHSEGEPCDPQEGGGATGGVAEVNSSQAEAKRRIDRLEREEFIRKCREQESGSVLMDENSQSILEIMEDTTSHSLLNTPEPSHSQPVPPGTRVVAGSTGGSKRSRCGSFLKRYSTASLRRLSSSTATAGGAAAATTPSSVGGNSGRGFVFQKLNTPSSHAERGNNKRTQSTKKHVPPLRGQPAKRPKLDRSISAPTNDSNSNSIFSMLS